MLDSCLAAISHRFLELHQLVKVGGFKARTHDFQSFDDAVIFSKQHLPSAPVYSLFIDAITLLGAVSSTVTHRKDVREEEIHYA
jgi:hypothetical protein